MAYSITNSKVVSILAKKNFSNENDSCDSIDQMPKSQLRDLLNELIGPKPKLTAREVSQKGGIAEGYVSELKSGAKDPLNLTLDAVLRIAKGLGKSEVTIFLAAIGQLKTGRKEEGIEQILNDTPHLDAKTRTDIMLAIEGIRKADMEFMVAQLREAAEHRLDRDT